MKCGLLFIRQNEQHVCIDRSELSLAAAGINVLGHTNPKGSGVNHVAHSGGCYTAMDLHRPSSWCAL
eukprot:COSAG02_NODE_65540_length_258_cov_0.207547_1_plen_66_part_10